ncbi:phosphodiester glycosidase family protein [Vasconcelosia minhoensis]|nr:phosphodiester glycosidase family protein [Romeria gracilis]
MRRRLNRYFPWLLLSLVLGHLARQRLNASEAPESMPSIVEAPALRPALTYQTYPLTSVTVHVLEIPPDHKVQVAIADSLLRVDEFAEQEDAIAVLNAGFFDSQNGRTTSHVLIDGIPVADPAENERLVGNPDLAPYLDTILNRSELRRYNCAGEIQYDIVLHNVAMPQNCSLEFAVGAGPQLLPENAANAEAFTDYDGDQLIRDAIGSQQPNARSAVGIRPDGSLVWAMVAQRADAAGMTLTELADFLGNLGIEKALNLDGGSSSSLYYEGETWFGRLDAEDRPVERPVKSVLMISSP